MGAEACESKNGPSHAAIRTRAPRRCSSCASGGLRKRCSGSPAPQRPTRSAGAGLTMMPRAGSGRCRTCCTGATTGTSREKNRRISPTNVNGNTLIAVGILASYTCFLLPSYHRAITQDSALSLRTTGLPQTDKAGAHSKPRDECAWPTGEYSHAMRGRNLPPARLQKRTSHARLSFTLMPAGSETPPPAFFLSTSVHNH